MFDTTIIRPQSGSKYVTVTENRAPTDESVKLLREMEDAARKQVLQSIRLESNTFDCVVHLQLDALSDALVARAVYKLNGRDFVDEADLSRDFHSGRDPHKPFEALAQKISKRIADTILSASFAEAASRADSSHFKISGGP